MLRGIGIELRVHIENPVWQGFFDVVFCVSSALLAIFFGAALGNVIRGVPLGADGYFFEPLWTNFRLGPHPGILDWYTVMAGVVALVTLTAHGALYVRVKTDGELAGRCRALALGVWPVQLLLTLVSLVATWFVRPSIKENYLHYPIGFLIPLVVFGSLVVMLLATAHGKREAGVCRLEHLHHGNVGGSGVCPVSRGAARQHRSCAESDHLQLGGGRPWTSCRSGLVDSGDAHRAWILRLRLPDVPRKGAAGRRRILSHPFRVC